MTPACIDEKTSALLNKVQGTVNILFVEKDIDDCQFILENESAIIYFNSQKTNAPSIACEVLRIWLAQLDFDIGKHLYVSTRGHHKLTKFLIHSLCDHINDCCCHFKLYTHFLEMGYRTEDFTCNTLPPVMKFHELKRMKPAFFGVYKTQTVQKIIKTLFTILATQKEEGEYNVHLLLIQQKLSGLYDIIIDFWQQWKAFDVAHIDTIYNSDLELTEKLAQKLEDWADDKIFILSKS